MPSKPDTVQITLRIPEHLVKEADALAEIMSEDMPGLTQTDVFRAAIVRGLEALRKVRR